LKLAQDAARAAQAVTPLGTSAAELYGSFAAQGHAGEDFSAIIRFLRSA
jgi:3-hydroxyisobutyrate dehydrogenase